jgi:hypothetical protein
MRQLLWRRGKRGVHRDTTWRGWLDGTQNAPFSVLCMGGVLGWLTVLAITGASSIASPYSALSEVVWNLQNEQLFA